MARILILDGHSSAALAFTRSAGRAKHWVSVGSNAGIFAAAKLSRYCKVALSYPVSAEDPDAFVRAIAEFVTDHQIDLVVPITDWTIIPLINIPLINNPLSENRELFGRGCRVALPARAAIELASDKYKTLQLAQTLGIRIPRTWLVESLPDLRSMPATRFPMVVKDRFSLRWRGGRAIAGGVSYAYSREDLERKVSDRLAAAGDVLVQEFTAGTGIGFSCFIAGNEVRVPFQWKRVREVDPLGSASSCRESMALDEQIEAQSSELARRIRFEGIAMVEYKQAANQAPILMEINGRPWGSIALPIACGVDYPRFLIEWWLSGILPKQISYQPGVTCRRMLGELTHLSNLRAGKPPNWPLSYPGFWSSLVRISMPWYPGMHYDDLWLSDPRPGIGGLVSWFRTRVGRSKIVG